MHYEILMVVHLLLTVLTIHKWVYVREKLTIVEYKIV